MRLLAAILLAALLALAASADAATRPTLRVDEVGVRTATLSGTASLPRGRGWTVYVAYRLPGRRWLRAPVRRGRRAGAELTQLRAGTRYAVRLVVTRCGGCPRGTRRSPTRSFTTAPKPAPAPRPFVAVPPPSRATPQPPVAAAASAPPAAEPPAAADPAPEPEPAAAPPPAAPVYRNPVHAADFPDPMVLRDGDTWFAYATGERFPMLRSTDLVHWTPAGTALPARPSWALPTGESHPWAPSVLPTERSCPDTTSERCFLLFHVSLSDHVSPTTNCIGVAASPTPEGPFAELGILERADGERPGGRPVGCGDAAGWGNIDPAPFVDADGRVWLYVSTDWACATECPTLRPTISVIPLTADALKAAGPREPLFSGRPGTWEQAPWAPVVEHPWVVRRGDTYHLLFSGGSWQGAYGMGHATATSPEGPFTRSADGPWAAGTDAVLSPGGGMVVADAAGGEWLAYHGRAGSLSAPRTLRIDPLRWSADERPALDGPSVDERPAPATR